MTPKLDIGDVALMGRLRGTPAVGDIVEITVPADAQRDHGYPPKVVHRIVAIEDGMVVTQGDNLGEPDPFEVPVGSIDRQLVTVVPAAGRIFSFLASPFGLLWLGSGLVLLVGPRILDAVRTSSAAGSDETKATLQEVVAAVGEYGYHLRSHTAILQSMSQAAQDLSSVVTKLEQRVDVGVVPPPPAPARPRLVFVASGSEVVAAPLAPAKPKLVMKRGPHTWTL